jgi:hypothetical protein
MSIQWQATVSALTIPFGIPLDIVDIIDNYASLTLYNALVNNACRDLPKRKLHITNNHYEQLYIIAIHYHSKCPNMLSYFKRVHEHEFTRKELHQQYKSLSFQDKQQLRQKMQYEQQISKQYLATL